jgi:hypothetical protein
MKQTVTIEIADNSVLQLLRNLAARGPYCLLPLRVQTLGGIIA